MWEPNQPWAATPEHAHFSPLSRPPQNKKRKTHKCDLSPHPIFRYATDMSRTILVVDPQPARRRAYLEALQSRFSAYGVAHTHDVPAGEAFEIYWVSLRQSVGHGLELGRDLKARNPSALVVVYGKPDGKSVPPRGRVEKTWQIDVYVPFVPEGSDINVTVDKALQSPRLGATLTEATLDPFSENAPQQTVAPYRTAGGPLGESKGDVPTWSELLLGPISTQTFRQLMKKDLFGTG